MNVPFRGLTFVTTFVGQQKKAGRLSVGGGRKLLADRPLLKEEWGGPKGEGC